MFGIFAAASDLNLYAAHARSVEDSFPFRRAFTYF